MGHFIHHVTVEEVEAVQLLQRLDDRVVDLLLTDIPYDEVSRESGGLRKLDKEQADELTFDLDEFLKQAWRVTRGHFFINCGEEQFSTIRKFLRESGASVRSFPWCKTNPTPLNGKHLPLSAVEMAVYAKKPRAPFYGHCIKNYWIGPHRRSETPNCPCPTPKPLDLFGSVIGLCTKPGDLVVDPCAGSGTTPVLCKTMGRRCISGDNHPASVQYARERLATLKKDLRGRYQHAR